MNINENLLAAEMLDKLSDILGGGCCNDFDFPKHWTTEEKEDFVLAYHKFNGDPEEFDKNNLSLPDFCVASLLAHKLGGGVG